MARKLNLAQQHTIEYIMKLKQLLFGAAFLTISASATAQAVSQGNVIVDAYYGAPNFGKSFAKTIEDNGNTSNVKIGGLGPMGLRAEYMVADRIGVGFDVIYNSFSASYTTYDTTYNSQNQPVVSRYDDEAKMSRLRVQARFNYHFDVSNPNLDAYFGVGAGTNTRFYKFYRNGAEDQEDFEEGTSATLIPVSFRLCTGMRYYFSENLGVNAEIGLGGPVVSAGLSLKF